MKRQLLFMVSFSLVIGIFGAKNKGKNPPHLDSAGIYYYAK